MTTMNLTTKQTHFALHLGQGTTKGVHFNVSGTHRYKYFASPFTLPFEDDENCFDDDESEHDVGSGSGSGSALDRQQQQRSFSNAGSQTHEEYVLPTTMTRISDEDIAAMKREEAIRKCIKLEREKRQQERKDQEASLPPIVDSRTAEMYRKFLEENERKDFALREKELDDSIQRKLEAKKEDLRKRYDENKNSKVIPEKYNSRACRVQKVTNEEEEEEGGGRKKTKILRQKNDSIRRLHRFSSIEKETNRKQWEGTDVSRRKQKEALDLIASHF